MFFFKKEKHFGTLAILVKILDRQCPGADLWQILLQLFLHICPSQSQTAVWGRKLFLSQLLTVSLYSQTSPLGIFTINWVSETIFIFVLVKATESKPKQQKAVGWSSMNDPRTKHALVNH